MLPLKKLMHIMWRQCSDVPSQTSCTSACFRSVHIVSVEVVRSALLYSEELKPLSLKNKRHPLPSSSRMYWHF